MGQDKFSDRLLNWFNHHGRHNLPWQSDRSLYRVWVSEIMLQQTQVATVIPFYQKFIKRFPTLEALAKASMDDVLQHWAGLGYYARGRNLHKAAILIVEQHDAIFPEKIEAVNALPGIGRSTAGAILALACHQRHAILDGNVKRTLCRFHGLEGYPGDKNIGAKLWILAERHTPYQHLADYTQAIMDMGAILCTRHKPDCAACPHQSQCRAFKLGRVDELPYRKPRKPRSSQHRFMLVLCNSKNEALLFKRPVLGIWGGLYSLPEFNSRTSCLAVLAQCNVDTENKVQYGTDIQHSFSHFDLRITPVICRLAPEQIKTSLKLLAKQADIGIDTSICSQYSLSLCDLKPVVGLPAPIDKLLKQILIK